MSEITDAVSRSGTWLLNARRHLEGGWGDVPGRSANTLNTAEAVIALIQSGVATAGDKPVTEAVAFLLAHQNTHGPDAGAWPREVTADDLTPDIVRTAMAVRALILAGEHHDGEALLAALDWMVGVKNGDLGWGFRRGTDTRLPPTCFALLALLQLHAAGNETCDQHISAGVDRLVEFARADGSFGEGELAAAHTILGALTLQTARRQSLNPHVMAEERAVRWLLQHPDVALRVQAEDFPISASGSGNYSFVYQTDALLVRVLSLSGRPPWVESSLADEALRSVRDGISPDGGVYGRRVFTWSTATAVVALADMSSERGTFPARAARVPERPALSAVQRFALLGGLFLLVVGMMVVVADPGPVAAGIFSLLILALLLLFGSLAPKDFLEALRTIRPGRRNGRSGGATDG